MQFDNIDKQIVKALFKRGRESLTSLKDIIFKKDDETMSHTGIAKRIAKLENKGILKVQGNININELNYKTLFILMEWGNYEEIRSIIESYSECPRVFLLAQVTGQYNLIMGIVGQNLDVLHRYVNHCGPTNKKGLLHSALIFGSDFIRPKYLPLNLFSNESNEDNCGNVCVNCEAYLEGKCDGCGNF